MSRLLFLILCGQIAVSCEYNQKNYLQALPTDLWKELAQFTLHAAINEKEEQFKFTLIPITKVAKALIPGIKLQPKHFFNFCEIIIEAHKHYWYCVRTFARYRELLPVNRILKMYRINDVEMKKWLKSEGRSFIRKHVFLLAMKGRIDNRINPHESVVNLLWNGRYRKKALQHKITNRWFLYPMINIARMSGYKGIHAEALTFPNLK